MPSWIESGYKKLASKKVVAASGVVYVLSQAAIGYLLRPVGHADALRLQLTLSARTFAGILVQWGDRGINLYINHFYLDYFHALIYAVFLSSAIAYLTLKPAKRPGPIALSFFTLPWFAAICDMVENTIHLYLIRDPHAIDRGLVILSGLCTWTKWSLAAISVGAILVLFIRKGQSHETGLIQDA